MVVVVDENFNVNVHSELRPSCFLLFHTNSDVREFRCEKALNENVYGEIGCHR